MGYDVEFQAKIFPMLMTAFESLESIYDGRLYAIAAPSKPTFPYAVYQSQDGGGLRKDTLNRNGWEGLITFRSIDTTYSGAWNKLNSLVDAIPSVVASGFLIEYLPEHPIFLPIDKSTQTNIYTAGIIVRFRIEKE